ncbi:BMP family ABC transporter substrate-binding protein [Sediminispirochaeta bajacaliforniensis]|uniref:BMP family ABC transporter substrate-binding protein n=1 Tax=Sediminispirochaeta bajacaliforniensis TaxID=148 RepID=UPI0003704E73|nr:BMP family ABC transporter substrate-binding protein [Sediminispirochaeta bajacaliforniensis]
MFFHNIGKRRIGMHLLVITVFLFLTLVFPGCSQKDDTYDIAVFIPGVTEGSPTYSEMADGVLAAAKERDKVEASVIEGGFNQGEWGEKVKALAASGDWDLIVTTNPALPKICEAISGEFPQQKFLILDGFLEGNPSIYTLRYHQMEQGYLAGTFAALVTGSDMSGADKEHLSVGMIVGQEYPDMNQAIRPGFERGVKRVAPEAKIEFRVVGNWFDASKGSELASSLYDSGTDVILTIAGGANQGVVAAAKERGRYVLWFDTAGYDVAPGTVIGSTAVEQYRAAYEKSLAAIDGTLPFGSAEVASTKDGWITFVENDEHYRETVPKELRERQHRFLEDLKQGNPLLPLLEEER